MRNLAKGKPALLQVPATAEILSFPTSAKSILPTPGLSYTHVCSPGSGKLFGSEFDFFAFMALKEANFPRFSDAGAHCDKWHRKFTLAANGAVPAHVGHRSAPQIAGGSAIAALSHRCQERRTGD
jgi:hypothetical protein